jgi:hypothetical protein
MVSLEYMINQSPNTVLRTDIWLMHIMLVLQFFCAQIQILTYHSTNNNHPYVTRYVICLVDKASLANKSLSWKLSPSFTQLISSPATTEESILMQYYKYSACDERIRFVSESAFLRRCAVEISKGEFHFFSTAWKIIWDKILLQWLSSSETLVFLFININNDSCLSDLLLHCRSEK